jgi:uncharacterized protein
MKNSLSARHLSNVVTDQAAVRLREFRREAECALPGRVKRVVLFGSRARGEGKKDSDYDVAVMVQDLSNRRSVDHALADAAYRHILAGFHIRPMAVPVEYFEFPSRNALAMELVRDGVIVS